MSEEHLLARQALRDQMFTSRVVIELAFLSPQTLGKGPIPEYDSSACCEKCYERLFPDWKIDGRRVRLNLIQQKGSESVFEIVCGNPNCGFVAYSECKDVQFLLRFFKLLLEDHHAIELRTDWVILEFTPAMIGDRYMTS